MPITQTNIVLLPVANQMPPSGWQPGFTSCFQLSVRNTGSIPVVLSHVTHEFLIDGNATGVQATSPCSLHIAPYNTNSWEHNPVSFPVSLAEQARNKKLALLVTAYGDAAGKTVSGSCCMPVVIADLPEPVLRQSAGKTALELMQSRFSDITSLPAILHFLDQTYDAMADLTGQVPMNGECMTLRETPPFFAWARAGFPILLNTTYVCDSINAFDRGAVCLGWLHEMGHNFEYGYWYMYNSPACECHANLKLVYAVEQLITEPSNGFYLPEWVKNPDPARNYTSGRTWVDTTFNPAACDYLNDSSREWESMGSNDLLVFYLALVRKYGWEPFKRLYRTYRSLSATTDDRPALNASNEMFALQMAILSHLVPVDMCACCAKWRIPLSEKTMQQFSDRFNLPAHIQKPLHLHTAPTA